MPGPRKTRLDPLVADISIVLSRKVSCLKAKVERATLIPILRDLDRDIRDKRALLQLLRWQCRGGNRESCSNAASENRKLAGLISRREAMSKRLAALERTIARDCGR